MREKVVFDTNFLFNKKASNFFGNRDELKKFELVADIIIPEIVIEELAHKYNRSFGQEKDKFFKTLLPNIINHNTEEIVVEDKIKELINNETIPHQIISLSDFSVLPNIKDLALKKLPPFEPADGTDKGFKDAYIYFTILEYIQNIPDKYLFVCVKDQRFKKAFTHLPNVFAIESYEEFLNHRVSQFQGDYFLQKLEENLGFKVDVNHVKDFWINGDYNEVVLIENNGDKYVVEVDEQEIVNVAKVDDYKPIIQTLINSGNFGTTHDSIEKLEKFIPFFNEKEVHQILEASYTNDQIRWIIQDEDVLLFIGLLQSYEMKIDNEEVKSFLNKNFN
jgi:rRNA-processing protein FCF1